MQAATPPDLMEVAWKHRRLLAALTIAAGIVAALVAWLVLPRQYTATAKVLYESKVPVFPGTALLGLGAEERGSMMTAVIESRSFALQMVDKYDLVSRFRAESRLKAAGQFEKLLRTDALAGGVLEVKLKLAGSARGLTAHGEDTQTAQLAATILDDLLASLKAYLAESDIRENQRQLEAVEAELAEVEDAYRRAVDSISAFQEQSGIISPEAQVRAVYDGLSEVDRTLAQGRAELKSAETAYEMARADADSARALAEGAAPAVQALLAKLYENQVALTTAMTVGKKLPSHPEVQQLQAGIDEIGAQLQQQMRVQDAGLLVKVAVAREKLKAIEHVRAQFASKLPALTSGTVTHGDLLNELELQSRRRVTLYEQLELAKIGAAGEKIIFTVLDPPVPPTERSGPSIALNCVAAMVAAFAILLTILFFVDVTAPQLAGVSANGPEGQG